MYVRTHDVSLENEAISYSLGRNRIRQWRTERNGTERARSARLFLGIALKRQNFARNDADLSPPVNNVTFTLITLFDPFSFHRDISGNQQLGIHCQRGLSRPALMLAIVA